MLLVNDVSDIFPNIQSAKRSCSTRGEHITWMNRTLFGVMKTSCMYQPSNCLLTGFMVHIVMVEIKRRHMHGRRMPLIYYSPFMMKIKVTI
jgi:hypothetical protein